MRKIAIILNAESDLAQCKLGLEVLDEDEYNQIQIVGVYIRDQNKNTFDTQQLLKELVQMRVDAIVAGGSGANYLPGFCDAFLRHNIRDNKIVVIGVAFESRGNDRRTNAAVYSMTEVPDTQVVYDDKRFVYVGVSGFANACIFAAKKELPVINLPAAKKNLDLTLKEALKISQEKV